MKKYILPLMSIAMLMAMASCSSSDDEMEEIKEESKLVPMTFTATQESNVVTRSALNGSNGVVWQTGDKISVFDGQGNREFTLSGNVADGKFSGTASSTATKFIAVYPYTEGAKLDKLDHVSGITLPAEQTATPNSFDPKAALMMAYTTDKSNLDFKNAVSLVKIQTKFACKKIVLQAARASEYLAGMCTLSYGDGKPSITFTSEQSTYITLSGNITANTAYYIAVPAVTLSAGWSISFTDNTGNVYTRTGSNSITFKRNTIINLGEFSRTDNNLKLTLKENGKVSADKQVDMGVFNIGGTKYRLIFTKSNLTTTGLAANESDRGDYFAWGATEPWYTSYSGESFNGWKAGYSSGGYASGTAPAFNGKYDGIKDFEMADDPARQILGGDWQIPTQAIWQALVGIPTKGWDSGYKFTNNGQTLFLPAAGYVSGKYFRSVGSQGRYWSGTAYSSFYAYRLSFSSTKLNADNLSRDNGCPVRPVRLVAVD